MMVMLLRTAFVVAIVAVTFLALVPGPLGKIIESGEQRHLLAFAMLPALSSLAWPAIGVRAQWVGYAIFGGLIEIAQGWMAVGRNADFGDWVLDMAAAAASLGFAVLIRRQMSAASA
ncbi:hypothetical protein [Sphingomonas sp. Y38-1Y]|uniref:hypothetical protein n=1 Tax=Sphingomonas sp. Y38-1Y TaxID=3078265 RepID=UPI0028EDF966|nr:hypothetical protein [Sphingomonas sp. Y38-1Y]